MVNIWDGTWHLDVNSARVWDDALRKHVADEVGREVITFEHDGDVQNYEVLYGDDPVIRMGFTARFDDTRWVPYSVRQVTYSEQAGEESVEAFKKRIKASGGVRDRSFEVGTNYGNVRLVSVDELTHYRVSRDDAGHAQSVLLRRMSEDHQSYLTHVLDVYGNVYRIRNFIREGQS
ncbi:MAG: hypothetical protein JWQ19_1474 [Subtercola sp.]|nr:hypothetical protein [Subtercola sp.]